ncbi:MAG: helix-turn-helix transcriptional regulator [Oscillospiraceae bacterium]|nr:helix-turn-helix transcriptional regulator [Oscillospiraceae bacterium]
MKVLLPDETLSRNLRFLRTKYRLSQCSLAMLAGISPPLLRQIEHTPSQIIVSSEVLLRLSQIFDIDTDTLIRTDLSLPTTNPLP